MNKNKRGISVMALVTSVTIIMILLTTATISGINTANNAKKIAFGAEIKIVQGAVDSYYTKNNATYPVKENAYTIDFSSEDISAKNNKIFKDNEGQDKTSFTVYELDYEKIDTSNLTYGNKSQGNNDGEKKKDIYVVSRTSGKVYYLKGLEIGGQKYYTVTDDIENLLSYNSEKNTVNSPVIKFEPSTTDWTNKDLEVKVVVPSTCTSDSIKFNDTVVTLSEGKLTISENGNLTVSYVEKSKAETEKKAKYIIANIDKEIPELVFNEDFVELEANGNIGYIKLLEVKDKISGVKNVKYEYGDFTDNKDYFKASGKRVEENLIWVKEYVENITVFVEDNAGNIKTNLIHVDNETKKIIIDK